MKQNIESLLNASECFERIYLINKVLNPDDERPVRDYIPGAWPTMGELRRLLEVAESLRTTYKFPRH